MFEVFPDGDLDRTEELISIGEMMVVCGFFLSLDFGCYDLLDVIGSE
jgi:hypothetical protein